MNISRRNFLLGAGAATSSLLLSGNPATAALSPDLADAADNPAASGLKGSLLTLGTDGYLYPGFSGSFHDQASVLTSVNLQNGQAKQTALPMGGGHLAMSLGDGRILCVSHHKNKSMVVDSEHKEIVSYKTSKKYLYGGHGLVLPDRGIFILSTRFAQPMKVSDHGRFDVHDLKTLKLLDRIDSGGLHPHEIQVIPGTNEIVASHYGEIYVPKPPFAFNVVEAKLTVYDAQTLKVKRHYPQPDFNAMVTHLRVSKDGHAYFVLTQYIQGEQKNSASVPEKEGQSMEMGSIENGSSRMRDSALIKADQDLQKYMGHERTFPIPYETLDDLKLPVPLPFVRMDTQTGERQVFMTGEANHLREQSVGYNETADTALGIYYYSDAIILHRPGKDPEVLSACTLGLSELRGVAEISGTPYVGLVGAHRGLVIYDLKDRRVVARFPYQYFDTVHLSYNPEV